MRWFLRIALVGLVVGLTIPVAIARATTTVETNIPFEATLLNCDGETLTLSGKQLLVSTVNPLQNGGFLTSINFEGHAAGTSSGGVLYHWTSLFRETFVAPPSGGSITSVISHTNLIGTNGAARFSARSIFHMTVTPGGSVSVLSSRIIMECR
jgi:hypothetical protein